MTRIRPGAKGTGKTFGNVPEVLYAYESGIVDLQAACKVRMPVNGNRETSVGRAILVTLFLKKLPFEKFNQTMTKKQPWQKLIDKLHSEKPVR
jgi:DNA-directed RNA polymerase subunit beta'